MILIAACASKVIVTDAVTTHAAAITASRRTQCAAPTLGCELSSRLLINGLRAEMGTCALMHSMWM